MNQRIERVREDIRRTEGKLKELEEYLKSLRIREKQLCDEELIKVMRTMAGKDGDVIALLDAFQKSHEEGGVTPVKAGDKKSAGGEKTPGSVTANISGTSGAAPLVQNAGMGGMEKDDKNEIGGK